MSVLHLKEPHVSVAGTYSESHCCVDCGYNTAPGAPPRELADFLMGRDGGFDVTYTTDTEVYIVRDSVWKAAGMEPWGGCLCIPCLERRIGRRLRPKDFPRHAFNDFNIPRTERLTDRLMGTTR